MMYNKDDRQPAWKRQRQQVPRKPMEHRIGPLEVEVRNDNLEQAIKVLDKKVAKDGIFAELKLRRFAEKPSEKKRRKKREAIKKARRALNKKKKNSLRKRKFDNEDQGQQGRPTQNQRNSG